MIFDHRLKKFFIFSIQWIERYHLHVAILRECAVHIPHVSHTSAHTSRKISSGVAKYNYSSSCHVFATMISHAFYNNFHATIANCKTFAGHSANECLTGCRAEEGNVTNDDILRWIERDL